MSQFSQDNLETLRQRATCPVCRTFYIQPRKLTDCSHVFCIQCIKLYLANSEMNFPKCPMCRKPILKSLSEINKFDKARAEDDIVNFVKQYEVCDMCNKPENPNLRCLNCNRFICAHCEPCHRKLKPSHTVEPIITTDSRSRSNTHFLGSELCSNHPNQEVLFLCVACLKTMCVICKDRPQIYHDTCTLIKTDIFNLDSCTLLKPIFYPRVKTGLEHHLPQFLYIKEISAPAFEWLKKRHEELKECLAFIQHYNNMLSETKHTLEDNLKCVQDVQNKAKCVLRMVEELCAETNDVLKLPADADTAIYALKNEPRFQVFFQLRRNFSSEPFLINLYHTVEGKCLRQVLKCLLQDVGFTYTDIKIVGFKPKEVIDNYRVFDNCPNYLIRNNKTIFMAILFPHCTSDMFESNVYELRGVREGPENSSVYTETSHSIEYLASSVKCCIVPSKSSLYTCDLLRQMGDVPNYKQTGKIVEVSHGYVFPPSESFYQYKSPNLNQPCIAVPWMDVCKDLSCKYLRCAFLFTDFMNCFKQPFNCTLEGERSHVFAFSGNRGSGCGLETVFVYNNELNISNSYATIVITHIAKFYLDYTHNEKVLKRCYPRGGQKILDTHKKFSQTIYRFDDGQSKIISSGYQTEITERIVSEDFLKCTEVIHKDVFTSPTDNPELTTISTYVLIRKKHIVPVKFKKVELLCGFDNELYFVDSDYKENLIVGYLCFSRTQAEFQTMCLIKQAAIDIPLSSLKPLTITKKSPGEILIVCSVKECNLKFVMIRANKCGASAIEYLEVRYPTLRTSEKGPKASEHVCEAAVEGMVRSEVTGASVEGTCINIIEPNEEVSTKPVVDTEPSSQIFEASVEELEMSPDGEIFYILTDRNGRSYCATTKYEFNE